MGYTGYDRYSTYMPRGRAASRAAWLRSRMAKQVYEAALKNKYKPNNKSIEIIGVRDPALTHITTDSVPGTLTQTTFDTTSRADSAQILLTNATGASKVIIAAWIRGKPVTRVSDGKGPQQIGAGQAGGLKGTGRGGFLHDKYVDYERIAQDGDITFETGNNFVVTADQVNKLADYYWKLNRTKKHIYTLSLVGFQSWFEPGEWYTLQIGGAGEAEYIDSTVECFDVRCSLSAGEAPSTSVSFREVEESWKFDSNEVARQVAAGDFTRRPSQNVVTVAAQYYSGYADYYCDGAADEVEIQAAIDYMKSGEVRLTAGEFNISSGIVISSTCSNLAISGDGKNTILNSGMVATGLYVIGLTGSGSAAVYDITIRDITFNQTATSLDASQYAHIYASYANRLHVIGCNFSEMDNSNTLNVFCYHAWDSIVMSNTMTKGACGFYDEGSYNNLVYGNTMVSSYNSITAGGDRNIITNNIISYGNYGIYATGEQCKISGNKVSNCGSVGIRISGSGMMVSDNLCHDNGADTGISNTNQDNFYDTGTDTQWAG